MAVVGQHPAHTARRPGTYREGNVTVSHHFARGYAGNRGEHGFDEFGVRHLLSVRASRRVGMRVGGLGMHALGVAVRAHRFCASVTCDSSQTGKR